MFRPRAPLLYGLLSIVLSLYVGSCGGSAPSHLERVFGSQGESYCESLNRAVQFSIQAHLTASDEDLPQLYRDAMSATLIIAMPIMAPKAARRIWSDVFHNGEGADYQRLFKCEDLAIIAKLQAENPLFQGVFNNDPSITAGQWQAHDFPLSTFIAEDARSRFNLSPSDSVFKIFLLAFVSRLDFFSRFSSGSLTGLYSFGVRFGIEAQAAYGRTLGDSITVEAVAPQIHSLAPGDQITALKIAGAWQDVRGMSVDFLRRSLYASEEKSITLRVLSKPDHLSSPPRTITLDGIEIENFEKSEPLVRGDLFGDAALIRIFKFQTGTTDQLIQEIWRIQSQWEKISDIAGPEDEMPPRLSIILDLQFNPGGSLDEALSLLGLFLPYQKIGTLETKNSSTDLYPTPSAYRFSNPLFIVLNHASASASELVSQVLQESGRALIIGERSYGKGIGQQSVSLGVGSAFDGMIQLTTFRFFGPSGRSIQMRGIVPDLEVQNTEWKKWQNEASRRCDPEDQSTLKSYCFQRMEDLPRYLGARRSIPATDLRASKLTSSKSEQSKKAAELSEWASVNFESQIPVWRDSESVLLRENTVSIRAVDIANLWATQVPR
jgi:C-terminal peptidase prc